MKETAGKKRVLYSIFAPRNSWRLAKNFVHIARVVLDTEPGKITLTISKFDAHNTEREAIESDTLRINCDPVMRDTIIRTIKLQAYLDGLHRKSLIRDKKDRSGGSVLKRLDDYDCHGLVLRSIGVLDKPITRKFKDNGHTPAGIMNMVHNSKLGAFMRTTDFLGALDKGLVHAPSIVTCYRNTGKSVHSMIYLGHSPVFGHIIYNKAGIGLNWVYDGGFRFEDVVETMHAYHCVGLGVGLDDNVKIFTPEELRQAYYEIINKKR